MKRITVSIQTARPGIIIGKGGTEVDRIREELKKEDGHNAYIFRINNRIAINALPYTKAKGRYANDAKGLTRVSGLRNNSEYNVEGSKCYIDSTRKILKGEEIFVEYGTEFWNLIRKIQSTKTVKEKRKGK